MQKSKQMISTVRKTGIVFFLFIQTILFSQTSDIVKSDGITSPLHQANIGRITFMADFVPVEKYSEKDFIDTLVLEKKCDLNIRVYMANSLTNYLHQLEPELSAEELNLDGNFQFSFYIDSVKVYTENLHYGAFLPNKNTKTVFRLPLISSTNEDSWGVFLWQRFLNNGGNEALTNGMHQLRIEIRPYIQKTELKTGEIIAQGSIQLLIKKKPVSEKACAVQPIKAKSGWTVSGAEYDKTKITDLNRKIAEETFKGISSIIVIKDGKLLIEEYFNGTKRNTLHDTRSVGKSFASALTGIAIQDGFIKSEDQQLSEFYNLKLYANYDPAKDSITIKDLLMMHSAFEGSDANEKSPGNEENMYPKPDWVKFALDLPIDHTRVVQRNWDYFTAGVIVLGDILNKSIPGSLEKYADEKLFAPLGITKYQWEYTPQKVVNTAGGIRLRSLDLAKFGQLYRNGGSWEGKQIIPKNWVEKSLAKQIPIPGRENEYYGYLFWNKTFSVNEKMYEASYCSGNGGNEIFIFKDEPLVVVITSKAYNKPYAHQQSDKIVRNSILPAVLKK